MQASKYMALATVAEHHAGVAGVLRMACRTSRDLIPPAKIASSFVCSTSGMVVWFVECSRKEPDEDLLLSVMKIGSLEAVEQVRLLGCELTHRIMCESIRCGRTEMASWAKKHYDGWSDRAATAVALASSQYHMLQHLNLACDGNAYIHAAAAGNMDAASWLMENRVQMDGNPAAISAGRAHEDATRWMCDNGLYGSMSEVLSCATHRGLVDMLQEPPFSDHQYDYRCAFKHAFRSGYRKLLEWAKGKYLPKQPEDNTMLWEGLCHVVKRNDVYMFSYMHDIAPGFTLHPAMDELSRVSGSIDILQFLESIYGPIGATGLPST